MLLAFLLELCQPSLFPCICFGTIMTHKDELAAMRVILQLLGIELSATMLRITASSTMVQL